MLSKPVVSEVVAKRADYLTLSALIDRFNGSEDKLTQLMYLQQIDMYSKAVIDGSEHEFLQQPPKTRASGLADSIYTWRNQGRTSLSEEKNLKEVLQSYGVHADASILLKTVQYATAYQRQLHPEAVKHNLTEEVHSLKNFGEERKTLFELLKQRYLLLKQLLRNEYKSEAQFANLSEKLQDLHSQIFIMINTSPTLGPWITEQMHLFALSYAAIDIVQEKINNKFEEYNFASLPGQVNNENILFTLLTNKKRQTLAEAKRAPAEIIRNTSSATEELPLQLVIRHEARDNAANEQWLQSNAIARFFVDDYTTFTKQVNEEGIYVYHPVAISQFVKQGNLKQIAKQLEEKPEVIAEKAQRYFSQISEFCVELMQLGFYHSDIKLSNFLVENDHIVISDRKAITRDAKFKASSLRTSIWFSPPEFVKFVNSRQTGISYRASRILMDAEPFMSFQVGIALKSFLLRGLTHDHLVQVNMSKFNFTQDTIFENLAILGDALTRSIPTERISLAIFKDMLIPEILRLPTEDFLKSLEIRAGRNPFAINQAIENLIKSETITQISLNNLLKPFGEKLELLDHDVEELVLQLFETKTMDTLSYYEYAAKIRTLASLTEDDSTDEERISKLYQAIEEAKPLAQQREESIAAILLNKRIHQIEKNYEPYLETLRIRKLAKRWQERTLRKEDISELENTANYLNQYLTSSFERKPQRLKTSFTELKTIISHYLEETISSNNHKRAWFFEKILAWLHIRPIPNRVTLTEWITDPDFTVSNLLLNHLSISSKEQLFNGHELLKPLLSFYNNSSDSYQKLQKLQEGPPKVKFAKEISQKTSDNSIHQKRTTAMASSDTTKENEDNTSLQEDNGSMVIRDDIQEECGSVVIHKKDQKSTSESSSNLSTPTI
ncbi:hypothetical protein [Legionella clemsonensis]|uniref:Uncharacterized protein n=1 Tax=Legionella clemsonensis TaxID=1867846 RepID=A0A222P124_9GAMM|nr:hypothetical protein [Legionella clemsonensis]ASQ45536.1 hypothetical protein clem_04890 [Legionella clemsonensis]